MFTTTVTKSVAGLDFTYSKETIISGAAKNSINQEVPTGTSTGALVNFVFNTTSGKFLAFAAVDGPLEIRTNSTGSPTNTFRISGGTSFIIDSFAGDGAVLDSTGAAIQSFTQLFVYNSGETAATLRADLITDPTPSI